MDNPNKRKGETGFPVSPLEMLDFISRSNASADLPEPCRDGPHHKPSHGQYYGSHPHSKTEMSPDSTKTSGDRSPDVLMI